MKTFWKKFALLAVIPAVALGVSATQAHAAPAPGQISIGVGVGQEGPWDAPPREFDDMNRRAFHEGIDAARWDFQNHRMLAVDRSQNFRHPPVPRPFRDQYRNSFARGYQAAQNRMMSMRDHPGQNWDHDHDHWHY
ncbi:hypothetical protein SAMN05421819_2227 [Bryocella elongata]|uniref:Uncharacterized protein n=1 Tax=Bryocella elongata TaxID=863522 RepID=A0A1H5YBI1_9BACT|nr:hypothetical protein [Bryocella elongata]SEG21403.1 hypothetical protein SAMN05421819_2227 [Bryocella elongata]